MAYGDDLGGYPPSAAAGGYPPSTQGMQYPPPPPPPQQGYTPGPPAPQPGFDWGSLLALTPAHLVPSLLRMIVPGLGSVMDDVGQIQAGHTARTLAMVSHLYQDPSFNALQYGQWPNIPGMPPNPVQSVPAGSPGAPGGVGGPFPGAPGGPPPGLRPEDVNRLTVQGNSGALGGYQPTHYPVGMPPRVLTESDTKTQLNSAEAEAWRRYMAGGGTGGANDVPPFFEPVIGPKGHELYLNNVSRDAKGIWHPDYRASPPLHPMTGQVAPPPVPPHPDTHGAGPPLPGDRARPGDQPPGDQARRGGPAIKLEPGAVVPAFRDNVTGENVPGGLVQPDGTLRGFNRMDYSPDPAHPGEWIRSPTQATGPNVAAGESPSTTSTPTTTSTSTTRQLGTTTSQPPRMLTTTTTQPPTAGGAVAAPGASGGASPPPPPGAVSPDMQLLEGVPMPPTAATTQTPTTTQAPTTAPPTSTTETPTTTQPPTTAAPPPTTSTLPATASLPLGPNPPRPAPTPDTGTNFPLGPGSHPLGYPSPAFQPTGEAAGAQAGRVLGGGVVQGAIQPAGGTAPGVETPAEPSILSRVLGPAEAQAGGPPGGPGAATAPDQTTQEPVPDEAPPMPTSELQPSVQQRADIAQAIARNTNGIYWYLTKQYGDRWPNPNDIPDSVLLRDGVADNAGEQILKARTADMARARAQATPEERAKIDAADFAYNKLYMLYLNPIGGSDYRGIDASLRTPTEPGLDRFLTELGPYSRDLKEVGGPVGWVGGLLHASSRSGAGIPNAPPVLQSVEQTANRGGIPGIAATQFGQGHTAAIPIARALGASGRVNQKELALIQQYLIPDANQTYEANYTKLMNTMNSLDAVRRGYRVDSTQTGMIIQSDENGEPHLVQAPEGGPRIAVPGPIGGGQGALQPGVGGPQAIPPQHRLLGQ